MPAPSTSSRARSLSCVITDSASFYGKIAGDDQLVFRAHTPGAGPGAMVVEEHHVTRFHEKSVLAPNAVALRDYDFTRPLLDLTSTVSARSLEPTVPVDLAALPIKKSMLDVVSFRSLDRVRERLGARERGRVTGHVLREERGFEEEAGTVDQHGASMRRARWPGQRQRGVL